MMRRDLKMMNNCICRHAKIWHYDNEGCRGSYDIFKGYCPCKKFKEEHMYSADQITFEIQALKDKIAKLEGELKKKKKDFAVTTVPVNWMDSDIRDDSNNSPSKFVWIGSTTNGFRARIPIRLMSDFHLQQTFGTFVKSNHICYEEMNKEMTRRGLL